MVRDLPVRLQGVSTPDAERDVAARAGRPRKPADMHVLERVRDARLSLPDSALGSYYRQIPA